MENGKYISNLQEGLWYICRPVSLTSITCKIMEVYASCVRSSITYGSDTSPLLADVWLKFERAKMQMIRWMCRIFMKDRKMSEELRKLVRV